MPLWSYLWWTRAYFKVFTQHDVENKQLKEENEKLRKEENEKLRKEENEQLRKENEQLRKENEKLRKKIVKDATIKESIKKTMEIKSPKEDKNMTDYPNWFDRNKFEKMLAIIDSNKFNYKNKIGEFKYIDIKDLVNNIKDNTISEIDAKKRLNTLNIIKNSEIKHKRLIPGQKELLNLFDDLSDIILTDKTLMSSKDENEKLKEEKEKEKLKEEKENEIENEKENENEDDDYDYENEDEDENETLSQNEKKGLIINLNDSLDEIIDKSKSFEEQIKSLKKLENLEEYWRSDDYGDKELKFKYFKLKLAHMSNETDKKLFE